MVEPYCLQGLILGLNSELFILPVYLPHLCVYVDEKEKMFSTRQLVRDLLVNLRVMKSVQSLRGCQRFKREVIGRLGDTEEVRIQRI